MFGENISQEFRLRNIDETNNYFVEEIEQNKLSARDDELLSTPKITTFLENLLLKFHEPALSTAVC